MEQLWTWLHPGQEGAGGSLLGATVAPSEQPGLGQLLRAAPRYRSSGWVSLLCPALSSVWVSVTGSSCPEEGRGSPGQRKQGCDEGGTGSQGFSPACQPPACRGAAGNNCPALRLVLHLCSSHSDFPIPLRVFKGPPRQGSPAMPSAHLLPQGPVASPSCSGQSCQDNAPCCQGFTHILPTSSRFTSRSLPSPQVLCFLGSIFHCWVSGVHGESGGGSRRPRHTHAHTSTNMYTYPGSHVSMSVHICISLCISLSLTHT